jgi:hypothetical protein
LRVVLADATAEASELDVQVRADPRVNLVCRARTLEDLTTFICARRADVLLTEALLGSRLMLPELARIRTRSPALAIVVVGAWLEHPWLADQFRARGAHACLSRTAPWDFIRRTLEEAVVAARNVTGDSPPALSPLRASGVHRPPRVAEVVDGSTDPSPDRQRTG